MNAPDDSAPMSLSELIATHRAGRSFAEMEAAAGGVPARSRWQQIASYPLDAVPARATITGIAQALKVPERAVFLACGRSIGIDVEPPASLLVQLLPDDVHRLPPDVAMAFATLIRHYLRQQ